MDHINILKRAWHILWSYKTLWVFGIILALTTASFQGSSSWRGGGGGGEGRNGASFTIPLPNGSTLRIPGPNDLDIQAPPPDEVLSTILAIGVALACFFLILIIVTQIARYVSETALIRMVDEYEETGERHTVWEGVKIGWSRTAFRLFLIDLVINLPAMLIFILLFLLAFAPLLLWITENIVLGVLGTVATVGLFFTWIFLAIITGAVIGLLKHFIRRSCVMESLGVIESIRRGYAVVRQNLRDAGLMWLVMIGISLGWMIVIIPVAFLLLPLGLVLGGGVALLVGSIAGLISGGAIPWILAGVVGIPIFILVMAIPLMFLGGLREVFISSTWTLTYRELLALESLEPGLLPDPDTSGLE